ncbi:MAG TPA: serine/threonine-protein kinase, partial [Thermomicrobiales bacterium]|nr:serine/threonine-protein kinase [Thermomicrobiales bacterium]
IMDFGIARVTGAEHLTSAGFMMGTPAYMAPEQVLGQEIDARTDLYALGVVFYYLLSGKLPFKGETPIAMAQSRINDQPTPLHNVREGLPPWLEPVLDRALAKQPEARFQTADLFREALRRGLAGLPMDASASVPTELIQTPPPNAMPIVGASTSLGTGASTAGASTANATMPLASAAPTVLSPSPTPPTVVPIAPPRTPPAAASPASRADAPPAAPPKPPAPPVSAADRKPSTAPGSAASSSSKATTAPKTNTGMLVGIAVVVAIALGGGFWWTRHRANQAAANQAAVDQSAATSPAAPAPASDPNSAASTTPAQTPPDASGATAASTTSTTPSTTPPANAAATPTATGAGTTPAGAAPNAASAAAARGAAPTSGRGAPATPPAIPGDELIQFQDAKVLLIAGRKADDEDVTVQLGGGEVIVAPRKGGAPIAAEPYARIVRATFVHARDPRWESALPHPADSPLDLPGVFHPARNWLVLQS